MSKKIVTIRDIDSDAWNAGRKMAIDLKMNMGEVVTKALFLMAQKATKKRDEKNENFI